MNPEINSKNLVANKSKYNSTKEKMQPFTYRISILEHLCLFDCFLGFLTFIEELRLNPKGGNKGS